MEKRSYSRRKFLGLATGSATVLLKDVSTSYAKNKSTQIFGNEKLLHSPTDLSFPAAPEITMGPQKPYPLNNPEIPADILASPKPEAKSEFRRETKFIAPKPIWTPEFLAKDTTPLTRVNTTKPFIAITIDDGFDKDSLQKILDIAIAKKITYTDFMKGLQRKMYPDFVRKMIESDRVEFGSHTEVHRDERNGPVPGVPPTRELLIEDISAPERFMNKFDETTLPYQRPPGGNFSPWTLSVASSIGYRTINWAASADYSTTTNVKLLKPGDIVLMHYRSESAALFAGWIDAVRAQGLEPTALSNLFAVEGM